MKFDRLKLCSRLKKARKEAKLKQEKVAQYLEIPVSAVSAFEAGSRKLDIVELFMLQALYNKSFEWFFQDYRPNSNDANGQEENTPDFMTDWTHRLEKAPRSLQLKLAYHILCIMSEC